MVEKGLVHVYTGHGKGKTSAACGLALRAWGQGGNILFVQFMKNGQSGELRGLRALGERIKVLAAGDPERSFIWSQDASQRSLSRAENRNLFSAVAEALDSGDFDLIVLDEIMATVRSADVSLEELLELTKRSQGRCELALTGRDAPPEIRELADYVSEISAEKHPYQRGVAARQGIEF